MEKENIIGIRTPVLRKYAKQFAKTEDAAAFLQDIPHTYYEENNLHMMLITSIKEYDKCLKEIEKCFAGHKEELLPHIKQWIHSGETYTIRYGIGMLMRLYLDEDFKPEYADLVAGVTSEEYYVNMMIAWYMATALAKQWDAIIPYVEEHRFSDWLHRKTIQKAVESYRITDEQKGYLRSLRVQMM